jgi:hypothetical protein
MMILLHSHAALGFETDIWPGEGVPSFVTKKSEIEFHLTPDKSSRIVKQIKVGLDRPIAASSHRIKTTKSFKINFKTHKAVDATCYGKTEFLTSADYYDKAVSKRISLTPQTTAEYLQYRAEGTHFVRVNGEVCVLSEADFGKKIAEATIEWWIKVVYNARKKESGWLLVGESVKESKRSF